MITDDQLRQVMPNLPAAKRALYLPHLNAALTTYAIDTPLRTAAFVAQLAHESGEFRWMEEIWGPTAAQLRYEPPSTLATKLGNTQAGDGKRFKGRGPIQITGRFNYATFGGLLGLDLVGNPALAATPEVAFATAGLYWQRNGLNELADARDFVTITRRINGGTNGLADRQMYYERAKAVLGTDAPATRDLPLMRGHEVIRAPVRKQAAAKKTPAAKKAAPAKKAKKTVAKRRSA
jgi:predicted chitinase